MKSRDFFVHPQAIAESADIGSGTRIWAFSHVMKNVCLGSNCNVGEHCYLESGVVIGNDVVIKNGVAIWDGVMIEDRAFLGPNCVFTNDLYPRSKLVGERGRTIVREGASIGANATIICGHTIGRYSLIGAGAVVTHDVSDFALMSGNPARLKGYVCHCGQKLLFARSGLARCECGVTFQREEFGVRVLDAPKVSATQDLKSQHPAS
jgi:acetyltransferase-like isoleucine patch superfamily enzyme